VEGYEELPMIFYEISFRSQKGRGKLPLVKHPSNTLSKCLEVVKWWELAFSHKLEIEFPMRNWDWSAKQWKLCKFNENMISLWMSNDQSPIECKVNGLKAWTLMAHRCIMGERMSLDQRYIWTLFFTKFAF
jgi:hypothetical protein